MTIWAMVPARGGSKSIPKKNLVDLNGYSLMSYGIKAAQAVNRIDRIICSSDADDILEEAKSLGIEVDRRPSELATDEALVHDVASDLLSRLITDDASKPSLLILIQPTSPFLRSDHIELLIDEMENNLDAQSGQTIVPIPHNEHAWNQRLFNDGRVSFYLEDKRENAHNKQAKPKLYKFGNLVCARPEALLAGKHFFAKPSVGVEIQRPYDMDVDGPEDLLIAPMLLDAGLVKLPHMAHKE